MKKLFALMLLMILFVGVISADVKYITGGSKIIMWGKYVIGSDTLDTSDSPLLKMMSKLTGDFTAEYIVRSIGGDVKVNIKWYESNDTSRMFNITLFDSLVAADSAVVECFGTPPLATTYKGWLIHGFGTSADTSWIGIILNAIEQ